MAKRIKTAILDLEGAQCASCIYAIEHLGRKVAGVKTIRVAAPQKEIRVEYEGGPESLEAIAGIVRGIGYEASIRQEDL